ncbi:hypothetical protein PR048_007260 [Dryococelus australis]|uniref:Uncharacterized protein n=1 Tax=Dryococelus australis TaxID=614101 RepID=A0ABQ9ID55_9NEOP|nr:hypothetical protein PR048_007260 [Dryococelus australis]
MATLATTLTETEKMVLVLENISPSIRQQCFSISKHKSVQELKAWVAEVDNLEFSRTCIGTGGCRQEKAGRTLQLQYALGICMHDVEHQKCRGTNALIAMVSAISPKTVNRGEKGMMQRKTNNN